MKKALIVLACVLLISGTALAKQTFWSYDVEGELSVVLLDSVDGILPTPGIEGIAGLPIFGGATLSIASGPFSATIGATTADSSIAYAAGALSVTLKNVQNYTVDQDADGDSILGTNAAAGNQGVAVALNVAPLTVTGTYSEDAAYALGLTYAVGDVSVGVKTNSEEDVALSLAAKSGTIDVGLLVLLQDAANGYQLSGKLALAAGTLGVTYTDDALGSGYELAVELADYPLTAATKGHAKITYNESAETTLGVGISTATAISGYATTVTADVDYAAAETTLSAGTSTALADGVTLTGAVSKVGAADVTYSLVLGVAF